MISGVRALSKASARTRAGWVAADRSVRASGALVQARVDEGGCLDALANDLPPDIARSVIDLLRP